tara:strand:+ start:2610 stop:3146 length:537 start_codon:yes stop_codon:yes gene_type:complete
MKLKYFIVLLVITISCKDIEPRRPINKKSISFIKNSIKRNKVITKNQESIFKNIIKESKSKYIYSEKGFWYSFKKKLSSTNKKKLPNPGDQVSFEYQIEDVNGKILYEKKSLGAVKYYVDKEDILPALREGIKLLKNGESAYFLFPSFLCHGYSGDGEKIGINQPLKIFIEITEHINL